MKICIVGASGKLGKYMLRHALDRLCERVIEPAGGWGAALEAIEHVMDQRVSRSIRRGRIDVRPPRLR